MPSLNQEVKIPTYLKFSKIIVWLLYAWVIIGVIALSLRVFLLAASANLGASFASFVYKLSNDYMDPFRSIFTGREIGETGYLDVSAIFAIIVYLFIAWGFRSLVEYLQTKIDISIGEQKDAIAKLERQQAQKAKNKK